MTEVPAAAALGKVQKNSEAPGEPVYQGSTRTLTSSLAHGDLGPDDGERSGLQENLHGNETRSPGLGSGHNPSGNEAGGGKQQPIEIPWDTLVNLESVRLRFFSLSAASIERSTQVSYWETFTRFAATMDLGRYSRRQLESKARDLLLEYVGMAPKNARHVYVSQIRKVWHLGLDLPWPFEKGDLPRPQHNSGPIIGPDRSVVERWVRAAEAETDPYTRAWFLVEWTYGLRPNDQQAELRRKHIVWNAVGQPIAFMVRGRDAGFKKDEWFIGAIPPKVAEVVQSLLKEQPSGDENTLLFPNKVSRRAFAAKHGLPWLTSRAARKFVKATCLRAKMEPLDRAYWQGHKPSMTDMDVVYGTNPEDIVARQLEALPGGPMGTFVHVESQGAKGRRVNWTAQGILDRHERGEIGDLEAIEELKTVLKANGRRRTEKTEFVVSLR